MAARSAGIRGVTAAPFTETTERSPVLSTT